MFQFSVTALDSGNPPKSAVVPVIINVIHDKYPPDFLNLPYTIAAIPEDVSIGYQVFQVHGQDLDQRVSVISYYDDVRCCSLLCQGFQLHQLILQLVVQTVLFTNFLYFILGSAGLLVNRGTTCFYLLQRRQFHGNCHHTEKFERRFFSFISGEFMQNLNACF